MRVAKKLALIAAGYGLAIGGGVAAVAVNEFLIPDDVQQTSGGMVAFGDMIVFVLAAGFLGLPPTWFLLRLCLEQIPRTLIAAEFVFAAIGPAGWLGVGWLASSATPQPLNLPPVFAATLGLLIAFFAIPRIVFGPVLLAIEAATLVLIRERRARALLAGAMLMDVIPLSLFALHMAAAAHR